MRADLDPCSRADVARDLPPLLAEELEAVEEARVLLVAPAAGLFAGALALRLRCDATRARERGSWRAGWFPRRRGAFFSGGRAFDTTGILLVRFHSFIGARKAASSRASMSSDDLFGKSPLGVNSLRSRSG